MREIQVFAFQTHGGVASPAALDELYDRLILGLDPQDGSCQVAWNRGAGFTCLRARGLFIDEALSGAAPDLKSGALMVLGRVSRGGEAWREELQAGHAYFAGTDATPPSVQGMLSSSDLWQPGEAAGILGALPREIAAVMGRSGYPLVAFAHAVPLWGIHRPEGVYVSTLQSPEAEELPREVLIALHQTGPDPESPR